VRDLSAFEAKEVSQVERAPGKLPVNRLVMMYRPSFLLHCEGRARVRVFRDAAVFHALMASRTAVGLSLVLDDGLLSEAARHGFAVALVGLE